MEGGKNGCCGLCARTDEVTAASAIALLMQFDHELGNILPWKDRSQCPRKENSETMAGYKTDITEIDVCHQLDCCGVCNGGPEDGEESTRRHRLDILQVLHAFVRRPCLHTKESQRHGLV